MIKQNLFKRWTDYLSIAVQVSAAPLVTLRIAFGAIMFISTLRFIAKGWISTYYIKPIFHFTYYGFDWIRPLGSTGMFGLFYLMAIAALFVMAGLFYRAAIVTFFICFTYAELIDKTTYLNHYYFVSIISFLMIWVPAHRYFSGDVWRKPTLKVTTVPAWSILIFKLQLFIVYFFAGLSKINYDWLIDAMPLRIWLPDNSHLPWIGLFLKEEWIAYVFSWAGLIFDLCIGFILFNKKTVYFGYFLVVVFHTLTALFFPIGMFPYIMMSITVIFFSDAFHEGIIKTLRKLAGKESTVVEQNIPLNIAPARKKFLVVLLSVYFILQLFLPLRYLLYPGHLFWTEEGFRYSWRVMLMEKAGMTLFHVMDKETKQTVNIANSNYLTPFQEKMMSTQPDMILQYAHFLGEIYRTQGMKNPVVTAESYVTLNRRGSEPFVDSNTNLLKETEGFQHKTWVLPFLPTKSVKCD
ncbi:MAG TPA: HTTM domain-containing protein [Cytophagaceae bacterium]|nr:HTTM domain-containing protein [Cytophagaceae bacterium]